MGSLSVEVSSCCAKTVSLKQSSLHSFVAVATHGHMSSNTQPF